MSSWREKRVLKEQRQLGLAPLEKDVLTGQEISPHLPEIVTEVPWFYDCQGPTLQHQRDVPALKEKSDERCATVAVVGQATRFRTGACPNCGSATHKQKECTQPRRRTGAKYTGTKIAPDEVLIEEGPADASHTKIVSYEEKRDRWAGISAHETIWRRHKALEEKRLQQISQSVSKDAAKGSDEQQDSKKRRVDKPSASGVPLQFRTTRDIDELPKFLENLNPGSAYFDTRTRSLRANPHEETGPTDVSAATSTFKGDNALLQSDGYKTFIEQQYFLLKHQERSDARAVFLPTQNERDFSEFKRKQRDEDEQAPQKLDETYGAQMVVEKDSVDAKESVRASRSDRIPGCVVSLGPPTAFEDKDVL